MTCVPHAAMPALPATNAADSPIDVGSFATPPQALLRVPAPITWGSIDRCDLHGDEPATACGVALDQVIFDAASPRSLKNMHHGDGDTFVATPMQSPASVRQRDPCDSSSSDLACEVTPTFAPFDSTTTAAQPTGWALAIQGYGTRPLLTYRCWTPEVKDTYAGVYDGVTVAKLVDDLLALTEAPESVMKYARHGVAHFALLVTPTVTVAGAAPTDEAVMGLFAFLMYLYVHDDEVMDADDGAALGTAPASCRAFLGVTRDVFGAGFLHHDEYVAACIESRDYRALAQLRAMSEEEFWAVRLPDSGSNCVIWSCAAMAGIAPQRVDALLLPDTPLGRIAIVTAKLLCMVNCCRSFYKEHGAGGGGEGLNYCAWLLSQRRRDADGTNPARFNRTMLAVFGDVSTHITQYLDTTLPAHWAAHIDAARRLATPTDLAAFNVAAALPSAEVCSEVAVSDADCRAWVATHGAAGDSATELLRDGWLVWRICRRWILGHFEFEAISARHRA
jgi:hypothetical protein